jgi:hypothetical protein
LSIDIRIRICRIYLIFSESNSAFQTQKTKDQEG